MASKDALLMSLQIAARDLWHYTNRNPGCFSEEDEHLVLKARLDLEFAAKAGGEIEAYIGGPESVEEAA